MAKKPIVTKETLFPRTWGDKELGAKFVIQPYATCLYLVGSINKRTVVQSTLFYSQLAKFTKQVENDEDVVDLNLQPLGNYLEEREINLINS